MLNLEPWRDQKGLVYLPPKHTKNYHWILNVPKLGYTSRIPCLWLHMAGYQSSRHGLSLTNFELGSAWVRRVIVKLCKKLRLICTVVSSPSVKNIHTILWRIRLTPRCSVEFHWYVYSISLTFLLWEIWCLNVRLHFNKDELFWKCRIPAPELLVWTMQHVWPTAKMVIISAHELQDLLDNIVKQVFQRISLTYSTSLSFPILLLYLVLGHFVRPTWPTPQSTSFYKYIWPL